MLSPQERREIDEEIEIFPRRQGAVIEALKVVQRHRRWVDDVAIKELAEYLQMSPTEVDSVATFYNLIFRKPVGRHVIHLCDSVSCWLLEYPRILQALEQKLGIGFGETTEDERFTLLPIQCLGACDRAPSLMIDEDTHVDVTVESLDEILERYE